MKITWIGVNLRTPKTAYRNMYKGQSEFGIHIFHDAVFVHSGEYDLPDDQWGKDSLQFVAQCEACGETYDALGIEGTEIECPYCGTKEIVKLNQ